MNVPPRVTGCGCGLRGLALRGLADPAGDERATTTVTSKAAIDQRCMVPPGRDRFPGGRVDDGPAPPRIPSPPARACGAAVPVADRLCAEVVVVSLAEIVVDQLVFVLGAPDEVLDQDAAVDVLEGVVARLSALTPGELASVRGVAQAGIDGGP